MEANGIRTNGLGIRCVTHLNLTRSMADIIAAEERARERRLELRIDNTRKPKPAFAGREDNTVKFRLMGQDGMYLHESATAMTPDKRHAWCGTEGQLRHLKVKYPVAASLRPMEVFL